MNTREFSTSRLVSEPQEISARLDQLKHLQAGWLDGRGETFSPEGLDWLANRLENVLRGDQPRPHLYPTPEGGVRAEWSRPPIDASLEVDLHQQTAYWHSVNLDDDSDEVEKDLDLNRDQDCAWLHEAVSQLGSGK